MDIHDPYQILPLPGFAPEIGRVVSMLDHVRARTLKAVDGLTMEQLDHLHDAESNSIGALLAHIAAIESVHAVVSFENRAASVGELAQWGEALKLGAAGRARFRGQDLGRYLTDLEAARLATRRHLKGLDDSWLHEKRGYIEGKEANNLYIWFHVMEDETNHRGQISWLGKRLPK